MNINGNFLLKCGLALLLVVASAKTIYAQTSLFVDGASSIYIKSITVSARGHVTNNGTIGTNATGILTFNGTATQNLDGSTVSTFNRINISNTVGISLGANVIISGAPGLDFTTGPIMLNNSSIRFGTGATWTSNNTTAKFFITNGTGLVYANNSGVAVTYPVGLATGSANYKPIILTNSGTADAFGVRVQPDLSASYNSVDGSASGPAITTDAVALSWVINETVPGGSTLTVTPQWNLANETAGFVRASSMIGYYTYTAPAWVKSAVGGATGANPYTKTFTMSPAAISFAPIAVGGALSPLPITLLTFNVLKAGNDAVLSWSTATETNNDYFEIERSNDAITYNKIAVKTAAGNSVSVKNYTLTDLSAAEIAAGKVLYYRLKQVDFDGAYSYTPIRFVHFDDSKNNDLSVYPNPTSGELTILYNSDANYDLDIKVVNVLGITVKSIATAVHKGDNTIALDLRELDNTAYSIVMNTPVARLVRKIILFK